MPPDPHTAEGLRRPSPDLTPRRSGASRLPRLVRGIWPLHRPPQPEILDPPLGAPTFWKSWLRLCALTICRRKVGVVSSEKMGARPPPHPPHRNPGSATANSGWWATPLPSEICAQSDPPPFEKRWLRQISAYNVATVGDNEKSAIMMI